MTPTEVSSVIGIKPNAVAALSYGAREGLREAYLQAHVRAEAKADCRYTVDRLSPYVRNELAAREREKVQAHLDGCATCRQRRDELADVNASLLGALVPVPLLLGSRTQQEWLSVAHLGKGTRRAKAPAKAAKAAPPGAAPAGPRAPRPPPPRGSTPPPPPPPPRPRRPPLPPRRRSARATTVPSSPCPSPTTPPRTLNPTLM